MNVAQVIKELRNKVNLATSCPMGCVECCRPVLMTYVEWGQIDNPVKYQPVTDKCPFLMASQCSIYTRRPLPCRWYGLANQGENHCGIMQGTAQMPETQVEQIRHRWTLLLYHQIGQTMAEMRNNSDRLLWFNYCMQIPEGKQVAENIKAIFARAVNS